MKPARPGSVSWFDAHLPNITAVLLLIRLLRQDYAHTPQAALIALAFAARARYVVKATVSQQNVKLLYKLPVAGSLLLRMPMFYVPLMVFTSPATPSPADRKQRQGVGAYEGDAQ